MQVGSIAAADVGVGVGKLADHFAQHVGEVVAIRHVGQQLGVLVAFLRPIDAVHGSFEEEVALLPPRFVEHLFPFGARIDFHFAGWQRFSAPSPDLVRRGGLRLGVDDAVSCRRRVPRRGAA